jgi:hypothetical protein
MRQEQIEDQMLFHKLTGKNKFEKQEPVNYKISQLLFRGKRKEFKTMSREYGMDPYDDSYDWQQKKDKKGRWRLADKPKGEPVSAELLESLTPRADVVPDITKKGFFYAALALAELPYRPSHITEGEAKQTLIRGLRQALVMQPFTDPKRYLFDEPLKEIAVKPETPAPDRVGRVKKFMTLDDVHTAASKVLVGAR